MVIDGFANKCRLWDYWFPVSASSDQRTISSDPAWRILDIDLFARVCQNTNFGCAPVIICIIFECIN